MGNAFRNGLLVLLVLIGLVEIAGAQERRWGSWYMGNTTDRSGIYAATVNDSGNVLGQYCYPSTGGCLYVLGMTAACVKDKRYPVLVNSNKGSFSTEVYCNGPLDIGKYQYVFAEFETIDRVVKDAYRVGIAIPLESDNFRVIRFDLIGSNEAIEAMLNNAAARTRPTGRGTRDQIL